MDEKTKKLGQFVAGLFGGVIFGVLGLSLILVFGEFQMCAVLGFSSHASSENWPCMQMTSLLGLLLGNLLGVVLFHFLPFSEVGFKKSIHFLLFGTVILPLAYAYFIMWAPFDSTSDPLAFFDPFVLTVVFGGLGIFILFSAIFSGVMTLIMNGRRLFRK